MHGQCSPRNNSWKTKDVARGSCGSSLRGKLNYDENFRGQISTTCGVFLPMKNAILQGYLFRIAWKVLSKGQLVVCVVYDLCKLDARGNMLSRRCSSCIQDSGIIMMFRLESFMWGACSRFRYLNPFLPLTYLSFLFCPPNTYCFLCVCSFVCLSKSAFPCYSYYVRLIYSLLVILCLIWYDCLMV